PSLIVVHARDAPRPSSKHELVRACNLALSRLPANVSSGSCNNIIDWASTLLVGLDDNCCHSWSYLGRHRIHKVRIQPSHYCIAPKPSSRAKCSSQGGSGCAANQSD